MKSSNAAAMREALTEIYDAALNHPYELDADGILGICKEALAKPPRNCDVGTLKEQGRRYIACCKQHNDCPQCPANTIKYKAVDCALAWAQLPYKPQEGGAE